MERVDMMLEPIRAFLLQVGAFLPQLILALAVLIAGWLLAKAVKFAFEKMLRAINFNVITEKAGIDGFLQQGGVETDTTNVLGILAYWLTILAAMMIAFNTLGLAYVTDVLGRIALFVPKVMVAVLILAIGTYFARFVATALTTYCKNIGLEDSDILGRLALYAIMVFVVLTAMDQISVGADIIRQSFLIILAAVALGLALAFGIGGQRRASELIDRWWPIRRNEESDE